MPKNIIEIPEDRPIKVVREVPEDWFQAIEANQNQILAYIQDATSKTPEEYLTIPQFMERCKISRWLINDFRDKGKLKVKQIGSKLYIPFSEVNRFFRGELSN